MQALVESSSEQLKRGFPVGVSMRQELLWVGVPAPVSSGQHKVGDFPHLLGEGLWGRSQKASGD